jgi:putative lipoprotein
MIAVWEAAKARGVRFRGIGQEPGWIVDILGDPGPERLELTADYGELKMSFDPVTREEKSGPARTFYRGKSLEHSIEVEITPEKCADAMSGQPYDHTVIVRIDGRELRGCGKKLE